MVNTSDIYKEGAELEVVVIDPDDPFVQQLIESCQKKQQELKKLNEYDPEQMKLVITI